MKALKNIGVGFVVSFVGSIPLGYLNIIGYQIHVRSGMESLVFYLLGVVCIEAIVIYGTLIFADKLSHNTKLLKVIEIFSIFFMLLLAFVFYFQATADATEEDYLSKYTDYSPFLIGIIFSSLNFLQIPFWVGWNLYLVNADYVSADKNLRFVYLIGTLAGTFCGMLVFVKFLSVVAEKSDGLSGYLMSCIIPLFFVAMAVFQAYKFYKKHYRTASAKK